ncbi:MAG: hypothetical protein JO246_17265, partial [Frankiaceae bacterium]|nr:hypothetical protein [Frankiaceae bacterium]
MKRRIPVAVSSLAATLAFGGVAYAATTSVGSNPPPQTVINSPTSTGSPKANDNLPRHDSNDDKGGRRAARGTDDPTTHDINDDNGGGRHSGGSDDPASHDVNDDNGGGRHSGGSDDPASHDANDDNGGRHSGGT